MMKTALPISDPVSIKITMAMLNTTPMKKATISAVSRVVPNRFAQLVPTFRPRAIPVKIPARKKITICMKISNNIVTNFAIIKPEREIPETNVFL